MRWMIFVVKAGLHYRGKSFRDQPNAICVWTLEFTANTVGKSNPECRSGCVLIKSSWPEWCDHCSCLGGDGETLGMLRPWGGWDHRGQGDALVLQGLCCTTTCRLMHKVTLSCKTVPWGSCIILLMNPWVSTPIWKCLRRPWRPLPSFEEMSHLASYSGVGLAQLLSLFCIK